MIVVQGHLGQTDLETPSQMQITGHAGTYQPSLAMWEAKIGRISILGQPWDKSL
jgi:hypothetical protein